MSSEYVSPLAILRSQGGWQDETKFSGRVKTIKKEVGQGSGATMHIQIDEIKHTFEVQVCTSMPFLRGLGIEQVEEIELVWSAYFEPFDFDVVVSTIPRNAGVVCANSYCYKSSSAKEISAEMVVGELNKFITEVTLTAGMLLLPTWRYSQLEIGSQEYEDQVHEAQGEPSGHIFAH